MTQVYPDKDADQNSECGNEQRKCDLLLRPKLVVHQSCRVHADEGDECAEVEQFGPLFVGEEERAHQGDGAYDKNVVERHMMARMDCTEDALR